jgi:hypothetical protein
MISFVAARPAADHHDDVTALRVHVCLVGTHT